MKTKKLLLLLALMGTSALTFGQNDCSTASPISVGSFHCDTIAGQAPPIYCLQSGSVASRGAWYKLEPTENQNYTISSDLETNVERDTRFMVYRGTCNDLICVGGDDDSGVLLNGYLSIYEFPAVAGETYYVVFDNRWNSRGFDFKVTAGAYNPPFVAPVTFSFSQLPNANAQYKIAVADMNGDYLDDIVTVNSDYVQIFYQGPNGTFEDSIYQVSIPYLPAWSMAIGDIDANGFNDAVMGSSTGVTFLHANATGTDYTTSTSTNYIFSQRTNFVDINNDGNLDVFICHDVDPNVFYINDGQGNLTFNQGGMGDHSEGGYYGSIWVDYDNDGDSDLFIAKCRGGSSTAKISEMFRNDGDGVFTNVSVSANMNDSVQTWSSAWNDFDNDGFMDAFIGANAFTDGGHKLMYNMGDGTFKDTTSATIFSDNTRGATEWLSFDFDNDGHADIMGANNFIYYNQGNLIFKEMSVPFPVSAVGDLNNDGFLDVLNGTSIWLNSGNSNNWFKLNLRGVASNMNGIGARVELYSNGVKQIRDVRSGEGFRHMHTLNVHFGIGQNTSIDSVLVKWPSGAVDILMEPSINSTSLVVEGSHPLSALAVEGKKVNIFPNPTNSQLRIENLDWTAVHQVLIYNPLGQLVKTVHEQTESIDVSNFNIGLYILQIEMKGGKRYAETFIKK